MEQPDKADIGSDGRTALRLSKWLTLVVVLGSLVLFAVLARPLWTGTLYIEDDLGAFHLPIRHFYAERLRAGESFLWNPDLGLGMYIHGEGQGGMCHPLHLLLYRFLPLDRAFTLELLLNYPLLFVSFYLLMRRWRLCRSAALFGAMMLAFGGFYLSSYMHMHIVAIMAHAPWLLFFMDIATRSRVPRLATLASLGIVIATASQLLLGYPQAVYVSLIIEGLYLVHLRRDLRAGRFGSICGAKLLGAMIACIQLVPTWDLVATSLRAEPTEAFRVSGSLHPVNLVQLVAPCLLDRARIGGPALYAGSAATVLVCLLMVKRFRAGRANRLVPWLAMLAIVGLVLSLGRYGVVYGWISRLPLIRHLRAPDRHVPIFHLAWVSLAAASFHGLTQAKGKMRWRELWPVGLAPLAAAVVSGTFLALRSYADASPWVVQTNSVVRVTGGVVLMFIAAGLVVGAARGHRWMLPLLVAFTALDLGAYGLRHKPTESLAQFVASVDVPENVGPYRITTDTRPMYLCNGPTMKGYRVVPGYVALRPARHLSYFTDETPLRLAGVRFIQTRYGATKALAEAAEQGVKWLEIPNPMPRARLVTHAVVSDTPNRDISTCDIESAALVDRPVDLDAGEAGSARVTRDDPGEIRVTTASPGRQLLVLTEAYDDDWHVAVDGTPVSALPVYGDFLGCVVESGEHEIQCVFRPRSFALGKRITLLGIALTISAFAFLWFGTRPARQLLFLIS